MLRIREAKWLQTGNPNSRLKFESDIGPVGIGLRFLALDGKRAYNIGINCQTCSFFFERLSGANHLPEIQDTADALRLGVSSLDEDVVVTVGMGLPEGEYLVLLSEASVKLIRPGEDDDYFVKEQVALWGEDTFGVCLIIHAFLITERVSVTLGKLEGCSILSCRCSQQNG